MLLLGGVNPVYSLPPGAGFAEALAKVDFVVSFASLPDETSERAHLILPDHTPLESWGDAAPQPGVRSLVQPACGRSSTRRRSATRCSRWARAMGDRRRRAASGRELPLRARGGLVGHRLPRGPGARRRLRGGAPRRRAPGVGERRTDRVQGAPVRGRRGPTLVLPVPSPLLHDGRGANLPWLQETPDPVTKIAWQSWAEISHETAKALGVERGDVLAVETSFGRVEVPALPRGGIRDDVIAIAIGQGHSVGRCASHAARGPSGRGARRERDHAAAPAHRRDRRARLAHRARQGLRAPAPTRGSRSSSSPTTSAAPARASRVSLASLAAGGGAAHGGAGRGARRARQRTRSAGPTTPPTTRRPRAPIAGA